MSLYRRGKRFWSSFYINGLRHQFPTGTGNRKRAEAVEQKRKADAHARRYGIVALDSNFTFAELAKKFIASGSAKPYHADRLKQLVRFFGNMLAGSITRALVREYRAHRKGECQ